MTIPSTIAVAGPDTLFLVPFVSNLCAKFGLLLLYNEADTCAEQVETKSHRDNTSLASVSKHHTIRDSKRIHR